MGVFKVKACVWNPLKSSNAFSVELAVDTGSTYSVLPAKVLEELGVGILRTARLADNRAIERPFGEVGIEVEGYRVSATPVVSGEDDVYILGAVTMEQLGLAPDPVEKKLKPVEALLF